MEIEGIEHVTQKRSIVGADGGLRVDWIDGVRYRPARPVAHPDGTLTEIARMSWDIMDRPIVQAQVTTALPGRVRAWGLHQRTLDRLFVASGQVRIACYDSRLDSPTCGRINEFIFSDRNPGLLLIPPGIYHGFKNIGPSEAMIISLPSELYDYERPDSFALPWDSSAARELIPYTW